MKIGYGVTVLSKGLKNNKLDGIGVYSKAILRELSASQDILCLKFKTKNNSHDVLGYKTFDFKFSYFVYTAITTLLNKQINLIDNFKGKIDIFFAPDHYIPYLGDTPVVATVMDLIPLIHPELTRSKLRKFKNYAFKKAILSATHIITISEYSKSDIIKYLGIKGSKISVVPLGVDKKYFQRVDNKKKEKVLEKYNIKKNFFIFIGTLQPRKNILRIIEAFEQLPQHVKNNNELIIIGQNGWKAEDIIDKLKEMQRLGYGKWLNYIPQDDLLSILQSAKALVYPSLYEGFGLPVIEAFASHCPVICSNTTSLPEVAGDAAILVNPLSVEEISSAICLLAEDEDKREKLIAKGLEQVKKFTWEKSVNEHLKVFKEVLSS